MDSNEIARLMMDEQEVYLEQEMSKDLPEPLDAKAEPGSVSQGTIRPKDLIPRFFKALDEIAPDRAREIAHGWVDRGGWPADDQDGGPLFDENTIKAMGDDAHYLLEDLFDALDEVAPDGHYFGGHPGDPRTPNFGFWPFKDN